MTGMLAVLGRVAAGFAAVLLLAGPVRASEGYDIDPDHTEVRFTWDHLGLSRQGGRFVEISGSLTFDPVNPAQSSVAVRIPLRSIWTGLKKLDDHLLSSGEFFDVSAYPEITFKSTLVSPTGERTAQVTGDLTFNGVTRPAVLDVTWNFSGEHPLAAINPTFAGIYASGFSATTQIRRSDWGLTRTIPYVSDEIRISIETELHRRALPVPVEALPGDRDGAGEAPEAPSPPPAQGPAVPDAIQPLPGGAQ